MKPYAIVLMGGIGACIMSIDIYRRLQQTGGSVTECYSLAGSTQRAMLSLPHTKINVVPILFTCELRHNCEQDDILAQWFVVCAGMCQLCIRNGPGRPIRFTAYT